MPIRSVLATAVATALVLGAGADALVQQRARYAGLPAILGFENPSESGPPRGWGGGPPETIRFDSAVVLRGRGAARIERGADSPGEFSSLAAMLPVEFSGSVIELRGFLRTEDVAGGAGLWLRQDSESGVVLQFDNMRGRWVSGTTDWTEYRITLPLHSEARRLTFGVLLAGQGRVWADALELLVDGRPADQAPPRLAAEAVLARNREFEAGSRIEIDTLTDAQVEHLTVLGRVWGFLKYHHPRIAGGEVPWDDELFRVLPAVLAARDAETRNQILSAWVDSLGVPESCDRCAAPPDPARVHLLPSLAWLEDTVMLGPRLSRQLRTVYENRFGGDAQFFVGRAPAGNPTFERELPYADRRPPDASLRILALFRYWNIIEYWFPYRDLIDDDWESVLREFLPRMVAADDWDAYRLELFALITRIGDTHAGLSGSYDVLPPRGECFWPVDVRFIEGRATVIALRDPVPGFEVGDVVTHIDGAAVDSLVVAWSPYYSASNEPARLHNIARALPRGPCGESTLRIERAGRTLDVAVPRVRFTQRAGVPHDRPGEAFQLLSPEVAYLKLSSVKAAEISDYITRAAGTRGLVIDIRNYPSDFVVFALGGRLVERPTEFARFTVGDAANPGAFTFTGPIMLSPLEPRYEGRVAILVDESSISNSEYTAMALRASPGAVVVGSTTAGADGNVSRIPLPGGLTTLISGIGVFYPDGTPTQRVGIVPDIEVRPTIEGIRAGRDEVLEAALRHILGPDADEEEIRRMAARPGAGVSSVP